MKVEIKLPGGNWFPVAGVETLPAGPHRWELTIKSPRPMRVRDLERIQVRIDGVAAQKIVGITAAKKPGDEFKINFTLP
jgi:hypothetical protein